MSELHDIDRRVAVLEQIAHDTATVLADIRAELRLTRSEMQQELRLTRAEMQQELRLTRAEMQQGRSDTQQLRTQLHDDFRWLLRFMIGGFVGVFALLAHGLHWF